MIVPQVCGSSGGRASQARFSGRLRLLGLGQESFGLGVTDARMILAGGTSGARRSATESEQSRMMRRCAIPSEGTPARSGRRDRSANGGAAVVNAAASPRSRFGNHSKRFARPGVGGFARSEQKAKQSKA